MMTVQWQSALEQRQSELKAKSLWRKRKEVSSSQSASIAIGEEQLINFSSNDYLGLANLSYLKEQASNAVQQWGVGSGASHLVCGHQTPHHKLEQSLAEFVGAERALLFSTGYMANLAVATALTTKQDLIIQDKLNHASLIDGAQLSAAQFKRYAHTDVDHAERLLLNNEFNNAMIMTDGVFSMDGNVAPLKQLKQLADQHQGLLLVDDAHGLACYGANGRGALESHGLSPKENVLLMGTLGKAVGSFGAFVAGDAIYIEQLIQSARSYIYTTALPPAVAATSSASIGFIVEHGTELRSALQKNIGRFKEGVGELDLALMPSDSAIQPLLIGDEQEALNVSQALYDLGFLVTAIRTPTVAKGKARLRFTFTASHTENDIDQLLEALGKVSGARNHD